MGFISVMLMTLQRLASLGLPGRIGYTLGLSLWTLLCLPTTPVELAAGYIFSFKTSFSMSTMGKTGGSLAALLLGRNVLRPLIEKWLSKGTSSSLHKHLIQELRDNPIITMSILRAAPLPTPFKIYGLSLFPAELVPFWTYAGIVTGFNALWSLVWVLTSSSASSLAEAVSGGSSSAGPLVAKISALVALLGMCTMFARYAKRRLQPPEEGGVGVVQQTLCAVQASDSCTSSDATEVDGERLSPTTSVAIGARGARRRHSSTCVQTP